MAFTARVKCVMLLVSLIFNGYEFADLQVEAQPITSNGDGVQGTENVNKQNGENIDQPLDLASILGNNWETENKPLDVEKIESDVMKLFKSKDAKQIEFSTQSDLTSKEITLISRMLNTEDENETDINQNTEAPWHDTQEAPRGENNYDSNFNAPTAFPFEIFNGQFKPDGQGGLIPVSSSYRPDTQSISSPDSTASSFRPKPQIDVYATTTPSYWYGSQGKFNPTTTSATVVGVVNPTDASITASTDDAVTSTTSRFLPGTRIEAKPDIPNSSPSHVNPTGQSFYPGKQNEIEISSTVPSATNPIKPNYWPEVPIRPNFGYGFGYHSGIHNFPTLYWPSSYGDRFKAYYGYPYHGQFYLPNEPCHNFQYRYNSNLRQWYNRESEYGKNIDFRFGGGANVNQYQGEWARPNPIRMPMPHNCRHRHYHRPRLQRKHDRTFFTYK